MKHPVSGNRRLVVVGQVKLGFSRTIDITYDSSPASEVAAASLPAWTPKSVKSSDPDLVRKQAVEDRLAAD